jgi:putative tricarboxylic transport membrane protein
VSVLWDAVVYAIQPNTLVLAAAAMFFGIIIGALPGLGPTIGIAMVLPLTIFMPSGDSITVMMAIFVGTMLGNGIPAVLLRIPGTASALLTAEEGYIFQQRGEGDRALVMSFLAATVGQALSVVVFIIAVIPLASIATSFLFPELFALLSVGLLSVVMMTSGNRLKGVIALFAGLMIGIIGLDPMTGATRLAFGQRDLSLGVNTIAFLVGILAIPEVIAGIGRPEPVGGTPAKIKLKLATVLGDVKRTAPAMAVGTVVGIIIGALPGGGATLASFIAHQQARLVSKEPELFGHGSLDGLATVDAAGNASTSGELIPTLALGIPGGVTSALMLAVLQAQGLIPGANLLLTSPALLAHVFGGLIASVVLMFVIGLLFIGPSVYITRLSPRGVSAVALVLVVVSVYAVNNSMFDVWCAVVAGIVGYVVGRHGYPIAVIAMAFILSQPLEANLRRGLVMTDDPVAFVVRPIVLILLAITLLSIAAPSLVSFVRRRIGRGSEGAN